MQSVCLFELRDSLQVRALWTSLVTWEVAGIFVVSPTTLLSVKVECTCALRLSPHPPMWSLPHKTQRLSGEPGRERRQHHLWCHWHLSFYLLCDKQRCVKDVTEFLSAAEREMALHECKQSCLDAKGIFLAYIMKVACWEERQLPGTPQNSAKGKPNTPVLCFNPDCSLDVMFCFVWDFLTIPSVLYGPNVIKSSLLKWKTQNNTKPVMVGDINSHFL